MRPDERVREFAEQQSGYVTGWQLRFCGLTDKQVQGRKSRGELNTVLPGVFRMGGVPDSLHGRLVAVALWIGKDGHFTGETAAFLLGLDGVTEPERISVARYSGLNGPSWLRIHRLDPADAPPTRLIDDFRIPPIERILAECAATLPARRVGRALDDALRRRLTTIPRLRLFLEEWKGRPGCRMLRRLLRGRDDRDAKVRSIFEAKMLAILRRIREHHFLADYEIHVGQTRYVLDFYLPRVALGIECHSFRWHIGRHDADARRDRRIRSLGIELLYFTWDDVCFHASEVETEIRAAIARRAATFSA